MPRTRDEAPAARAGAFAANPLGTLPRKGLPAGTLGEVLGLRRRWILRIDSLYDQALREDGIRRTAVLDEARRLENCEAALRAAARAAAGTA